MIVNFEKSVCPSMRHNWKKVDSPDGKPKFEPLNGANINEKALRSFILWMRAPRRYLDYRTNEMTFDYSDKTVDMSAILADWYQDGPLKRQHGEIPTVINAIALGWCYVTVDNKVGLTYEGKSVPL